MIFVGVGSSNPLFMRQRRYWAAVGRFSKIDVSVSRYEYRPTIYNQFNLYGSGFPTCLYRSMGARPYDYRWLYKCQHALSNSRIYHNCQPFYRLIGSKPCSQSQSRQKLIPFARCWILPPQTGHAVSSEATNGKDDDSSSFQCPIRRCVHS